MEGIITIKPDTNLGKCFATLIKHGDIRKCYIKDCGDYAIMFGSNSGAFCRKCTFVVCKTHLEYCPSCKHNYCMMGGCGLEENGLCFECNS